MPTQAVSIAPGIFRTYDIRGVVDEDLTEEGVYLIGRAFASDALQIGEKTVIVGRDGRLSSPHLSAALQRGLCESGCDVIDIGMASSPMLYFATHTLESRSGIMVTGSHNPSNYNGLKLVLAGKTLVEGKIQELRQRIEDHVFAVGSGTVTQQTVLQDYENRICADVQLSRPLKIVLDCGNGAAALVAPTLLRKLGCEVVDLFCEVDGRFPNHHPDPSVPENLECLIDKVKSENADLGIAFDGDGDRLGMVTNTGKIIWPDRQMMLFAKDVLAHRPNEPIVFDVKCSRYLRDIVEQYGGEAIMYKTGHSLLKQKLQELNAPLAGEMSGHIFFNDRWFGFDDALYAAARLLACVAEQDKTSDELFQEFPDSINTPELKVAMPDSEKVNFMSRLLESAQFSDAEVNTIDGLRVDFADGWGLVRSSNTTPYLTLRFEADSKPSLERIQQRFRHLLLSLNADLELPF